MPQAAAVLNMELRLVETPMEAWEGEGGALNPASHPLTAEDSVEPGFTARETKLTGTVNQVAWAEQIRARVSGEFDRVAKALESVASKEDEPDRQNTRAMIAILEEKRGEVMAQDKAGYFIHDWQELLDKVRRMVIQDPRYPAIKASRNPRPVRPGC